MTIDKLAIMVQEGFMAMAKQEDLLALIERMDKFERNGATRGEVVTLDVRLTKLEKKIIT